MTTEIIGTHGPDSFLGRLASTMQGSTDTTLYIITVYFGAVGIRKMGYALKVGLVADVIGIIASIIIVTIVFN
ncbi:Spore maturation protein [Lentibacillus sp. JNUCC-1]|nr:Spore maturation protein [Lentibacillus sp. JNUCC-1]